MSASRKLRIDYKIDPRRGRGEPVLITRPGKPVAQIVAAPPQRRKVVFGGMKDQVELLPGWDDPIDLDSFLAGDA